MNVVFSNLEAETFRIGLMDSGMGGISVLNQLDDMLQGAAFIYYGDLKNSPYGNKPKLDVINYTLAAVDFLVDHGAKAIVIACNTATSVAIEVLRKKYTLPIFGMEPALKPASMHHRVGVLATSLTLNEDKFLNLKENLLLAKDSFQIHHFSCDGLATLIDKGELEEAKKFLEPIMQKATEEGIQALVLGCTHYVFLQKFIAENGFRTFDGNEGTARHLISRLKLKTKGSKSLSQNQEFFLKIQGQAEGREPFGTRSKNSLELFLNTDSKVDYKIVESYLNKNLKEVITF